jgi:serine phosphatase RsbU (regulator of sigma subunit)/ligand-binding sensor domain-containing protein
MKSGLPHNQVLCIYQDATGYIWSGTMGGGIAKFNGTSFKNYDMEQGLTNSIVRAITQDSSGRMWFGTMGGGVHYMHNDSIYAFKDSTINNSVYSLFTDYKGQVWVGHGGGISIINNMKVIPIKHDLPAYAVTHIMGDAKNNVWFNYNDKYGIFKYNEKELVKIDSTKGLTQNTILFTYEDTEGIIWIGTSDGLYSFPSDSNSPKITLHGKLEGIPENFTFQVTEDRFNNLIIGTGKDGFIRWNKKNNKKVIVNSSKGIAALNVFRAIKDREGIVWLSAYGKGLTRFNDALFTTYSKKEGIKNKIITDIITHGDSIWVSTSAGIYLGINGTYTQVLPKQITTSISSIHKDNKNRLWLTGENLIGYIKNNRFINLDPDNKIISYGKEIAEDSKGNIYINSWGDGIWKYANEFTFVPTPDSIVTTHSYGISFDNDDNLWIGSFGYGAIKMNSENTTIFSYDEGVLSDKVFTVAQGNNSTMYLGTNGGGLAILKNGKFFKNITKSDGLLHNAIVSLFVDGDTIWCASVKGLSRIIMKPSGAFTINNYTKWEGFNAESMNASMAKTSNGKLLIGTSKGLIVYNKEEDKPLKITPGITLTSILLDYGETDLTTFCDSINEINGLPSKLVLPYSVKQITFNFEGVCMNYTDELTYSYRLKGMDEKYSPPTISSEVTFHELPAGTYAFEVIATSHGVTSLAASYSFEVLKPFWETLWFISLIILFTIIIIIGFFRYRTAKLRKAKMILEQTVRTRTSELRTQKEIVEEKNREILDSINYAKRIQSAILPTDKIVKEYLKDSFILYKPKDIVAGDFYWMEHKEGKILFAAADCTGHGVPGAMVSVVCNNALNRSVREHGLSNPGKILDKTREIVIEEFEKSDEEVKDGMDIALCSLKGNILEYAGAHNPLWIIRNGEIIQTKGDKQPVGEFYKNEPYTTHTFELQKGDTFYIFSDGYVDQFGGEKGKKFKSKSFRELLLTIQDKSMEEQRKLIDDTFESWKGNLEQVDDVCVIGVRI